MRKLRRKKPNREVFEIKEIIDNHAYFIDGLKPKSTFIVGSVLLKFLDNPKVGDIIHKITDSNTGKYHWK